MLRGDACDVEEHAKWQLEGTPTPPLNPVGYSSSDAGQSRHLWAKKEEKNHLKGTGYMQTNNLDSECITICFRDELGFHPNATRISIISAVAVCPQMYFSMSDSFAGPLGLLGFNDKGKKCVDYFKRRRRKRRSEMTKMLLAINCWSELSYYLETQTDVRFSREANASQSEKAMKERRDDV